VSKKMRRGFLYETLLSHLLCEFAFKGLHFFRLISAKQPT